MITSLLHFPRTMICRWTTRKLLVLLGASWSFFGTASADFATEIFEATFKLFDPAVTGTCFLVRRAEPDQAIYLVTAAHMLEGTKADQATIVLRERCEDGTFKRHNHAVAVRRDGKAIWVRHPKDDIGVLRLTEPFPVPFGTIPLSSIADPEEEAKFPLKICASLFTLTYPKGFEGNSAGFPVARQGIVASFPMPPISKKHTFLADITAFGGDSGGPAFIASLTDHPTIIGIVVAQFRHDEQIKMEYEERSIHYPLGLAEVVHAKYIRETIELAALSANPPLVPPDKDPQSKSADLPPTP
ncbi:MAG: serine protease [Verrucomicrobiota bacterium]